MAADRDAPRRRAMRAGDAPATEPLASSAPARHVLSAGALSLTIREQAPGFDPLFRIAERRNPKRAFLFVSTVLGRHIPVAPDAHRRALNALADRVASQVGAGAVFVMSYAETAIGLGLGVFDRLQARLSDRRVGYLPTTRFRPAGRHPWFETREEHSHAVDHMIFHPRPGILPEGPDATLVLIDDETTTGNTFKGLAAGLARAGLQPNRVVLATLTDWSAGASARAVAGVFNDAQVAAVSLLSGSYDWRPAPGAAPRALPPGCAPGCPAWRPEAEATFGVPRQGLDAPSHRADRAAWRGFVAAQLLPRLAPGARVLAVGTGEHVWRPFLAAEQIAQSGRAAGFIATTRSPVACGPVISEQITFPDHYGIGLTMYLNNVRPGDWDEIILFTETGLSGVPDALRRALGKGWIVAADGIAPMGAGGADP